MSVHKWFRTICRTFDIKRPPWMHLTLIVLSLHVVMGSADSSTNLQSIQSEYHASHWMFLRDNPRSRLKRESPDVLVANTQSSSESNQISCNATFEPHDISIVEKELQAVNCSIICEPQDPLKHSNWTLTGLRLQLRLTDLTIAIIEDSDGFNSSVIYEGNIQNSFSMIQSALADGSFTIRGRAFGKTDVELQVIPMYNKNDDVTPHTEVITHSIIVTKSNSVINIVYLIILGIMIVMYNFGFGCKIEWARIVAIFKKPVAPAIGFCCQFLIMAPLSFGIAKLLNMSDEAGLGLLAIGAAPGGGGSNVFSYLLDGDLELSITMSFISTVASLGMTPLWIWGLGRFFVGDNPKIKIPITSVFSSLAVVTIPVMLGLLVRRFKPEAAKKIAWCLKPFTGVIGVVFLSMGVYVYYSALVRVTWNILVACIVVPVCGYAVGAIAGKVFRQTRPRWITISLETGFQNLALSLMIIGTSLEQPESDLAGVVPICYTFLSASIPTLLFIIKFFYRMHKGDCPWKKTESLDLSPLHKPWEHDTPEMGHELPLDSNGVTCTISSVLDHYDLKPEADVMSSKLEKNGNECNGISERSVQDTRATIKQPNGHTVAEDV